MIGMALTAKLLQIVLELLCLHQIPDLSSQYVQLRGIQSLRAVVLLDQPCESGQWSVHLCLCKRWNEVVDDDRVRASLGLRALARVVDHERIKQREIAQQHIGSTIGGHRHTLAR